MMNRVKKGIKTTMAKETVRHALASLDDFDPLVSDGLAAWHLFRKMGYASGDIYLVLSKPETSTVTYVLVEVKYRGHQAAIGIGETKIDRGDFAAMWSKASTVLLLSTDKEREEHFDMSRPRKEAVAIISRMISIGMGTTPIQITRMEWKQ